MTSNFTSSYDASTKRHAGDINYFASTNIVPGCIYTRRGAFSRAL
ncbi:hypothetical protein HMPREF1554_01419 [Porphyromonas gingivalis F0569]|nr:hypothetical protein HMPREF1554_01419 [Porphyromonas gingivalis F0569]